MSSVDFQLYPDANTMDPSFNPAFGYQNQRHHDYVSSQMAGPFDMNSFDAAPSEAHYGMFPTPGARSSPAGQSANYSDEPDMQLPSSNLSVASAPSATSSAVGSPVPFHHSLSMHQFDWSTAPAAAGLGVGPAIAGHGEYIMGTEYSSFQNHQQQELGEFLPPSYEYKDLDPSLIHEHHMANPAMHMPQAYVQGTFPGSPVASPQAQMLSRGASQSPFQNNYQFSPYPVPTTQEQQQQQQQQQQPQQPTAVAVSRSASQSQQSYASPPSFSGGHQDEHVGGSGNSYHSDDGGDSKDPKQRCPFPECGKTFKDLKAHMLTHQMERPEKCPIANCSYHTKGFARKYDKNRHTLTHYKGTMVCGFCPGSGSPAEKSFNRADVFKRHLTAVHGVEQTPPNSRRKAGVSGSGIGSASSKKLAGGYPPDATGKCSTCSQTFGNAQDFYEHLDDCVLRIVQQEDPAEAINAQRLAEVENDRDVHATLEKNKLPVTTQTVMDGDEFINDDGDDDMDAEDDEEVKAEGSGGSPTKKASTIATGNGVSKSKGMTHSRGGRPMPQRTRGRKHRRDYPSSWGFDRGQMVMKKRVMAVFEGPRRLAKDDLMLSTEHEVRVPLSDGRSYVTDLDVQTLKRAAGFLGATDEEKGPWISDDPTEEERRQMELELEALGSKSASLQ